MSSGMILNYDQESTIRGCCMGPFKSQALYGKVFHKEKAIIDHSSGKL